MDEKLPQPFGRKFSSFRVIAVPYPSGKLASRCVALTAVRGRDCNGSRLRKLQELTSMLNQENMMPNPGQPTIEPGATGEVVRRLQRALRRTPNLGLAVDGVFGSQTEAAVKEFQAGAGLGADGIVGPATWNALPDGGPMPTLKEGYSGEVVRSLQTVLTNGAPGEWNVTPQGIDGDFGPQTRASVEAFQRWGGVPVDGIVGDLTWSVSLHAASATLETKVGLNFVID